ncbi:nitric oxide synthase isoform X1 [Culex quinquefasciatus]|uniref:nitric oxide synthase isoform X1 n=1 Tax=Culex quinquefasciatus TaxID=7176 RepID=UPI0018E2E0B4|nr:nitric oxide synthase isoform X1 [Culex quinquefasciatus]XP_038108915.1 nitric oxide synthase isoform X1 [Culex quinquefasciatus]
MMSQHLNSMLEHLKMGSLMNKGRNNNSNGSAGGGGGSAASNGSASNGTVANHIGNGLNNNNNGSVGTNTNNNNNHVTGLKTPDKNGSAVAVDGFPDHRPQAPSEVIKVTPSDTVTPPVVMGGKSGHGDGHHPPASGHRFEPGRKRCSISVHSQHNQHLPGGDGGGPGGGSNGDAIRPGGYRELSPQSLRIHRKSSHDIRILGADGETLHGFMEGGKMPNVVKPMKLKCISTKAESYDTLHGRALDVMHCSKEVCTGSVMLPNIVGTEPRKPDIVLQHAKDFLDQYYSSIRRLKSPAHEARLQQVQKEIEASGIYQLTETELIYGAKLAWRNSSRCIGRIQWSKLQVFDCRYVTTTSGMFEAICNHIKYATNKGNLRSAITIFPQRTDGTHDYRIWNGQLISYAGYKGPDGKIIGDPMHVEFTDFCIKLGWKSKRTEWDILPLVLSANGHDPDYFDFPPDLIMEVPFSHPTFKWFADLNLRWYALPAVSGMLFDCGGIQFTATAFSGWYMSTEIGCRNLCDTNRRNMLEPVAIKMGLDTRNPTSLWKDKALVEINIAVLHSFQSRNITIVDHHTASESFMKHYENETKLRNGCPADWVWIVPPMSAAITQVYHQEMACYYLRPSFEYQESALKTHIWKKDRGSSKNKKPRRKFNFKQIARAVKFTSKLFGRALSRRIKATVLYATETGRSEQYAKQLVELLGHAFNAQIYCMSDYDISSIEHEALLLVVASTFGNGDPPENGELFAQDLYAMRLHETGHSQVHSELSIAASSKSFIKANSRSDMNRHRKIDRLDSLRGSTTDTLSEETFGPLSNVRFAVFALGSSAYPNFCAYGKYIDNILDELGGERLMRMATGDEICGQEQAFRKWAPEVFKIACETFCLDPEETLSDAAFSMQTELTENTVRFAPVTEYESLDKALSKYHNKKATECTLKRNAINLHEGTNGSERSTILVEIIAEGMAYEPGDHVGIFPANRAEIVDGIIKRLTGVTDPDETLQLQVLKEKQTQNGVYKSWEQHERIPICSLRTLLSRFLDITTPPSRQLLTFLASCCQEKEDEERLTMLANEPSVYEDWRYWKLPHLLEVLEEFPSCKPPATVFVAQLNALQPRFYSISSSPRKYSDEIHLTVAIVSYRAEDGEGAEHYGVCSNYLANMVDNEKIYLFVRSASSFHMSKDPSRPVILIGPGTGIAPFRSFWQEWDTLKTELPDVKLPKVWLFFGCRTKKVDLYRDEKEEMVKKGILDRVFLALSREENVPKTYVQDLALTEADSIFDLIWNEKAHIYVCGDVTMAEHVYQTLRKILAGKLTKTESEMEKYMLSLRDENRYHEDIFGITLRTAEVHNKSRATARIRMASQPS